jgi:hypothetical protein
MAMAPVLSVFFIVPLELYMNAAEYWRWNASFPLSFVLPGLAVYGVLLICLYIARRFSDTAFKGTALALFFLGIYILLADILSPLQTGPLDGSKLESDEPFFYTALEIALVPVLLLLGYRLRRHLAKVAMLASLGLLLIALLYSLLALVTKAPVNEVADLLPGEQEPVGNIYHFVLDELQSDAAIAVIENRRLENAYDGFRLYRNNSANYLWTHASMPSYLTGEFYEGGDFLEWREAFKQRGLFTALYEGGYQVNLYAVYDNWCATYMHYCVSLEELFEAETGLLASDYITFIQIWLARIAPNFLANRALQSGKELGTWVYAGVSPGDQDIPTTIPKGKAPFASVLMLRQVLADEAGRTDTGQYVYAHAILPHGPYVINENCHFDAGMWRGQGGKRAYFEQASCGLAELSLFLEELKRLGRYNNATIIIHSDTGHGHQGFYHLSEAGEIAGQNSAGLPPLAPDKDLQRSETWYLARSMALLMFKPPGSEGPMEVVSDRSQLVDVYPTILDVAGIDGGKVDGISLAQETQTDERQSKLYYTSPAKTGEFTELKISDPDDIPASQITFDPESPSQSLADSARFLIGRDDSDIHLSGFSYPENDPQLDEHWRWVTATEASIDLSPRLVISAAKYLLELELEPFVGNRNTLAEISIGDHTRELQLSEGWESYRLSFDFAGDETPLIKFRFESAVSPEELGMSADTRPLAARIGRLEIRPYAD